MSGFNSVVKKMDCIKRQKLKKNLKKSQKTMNQKNNETVNIELSSDVISLWKENDESKYSELIKELGDSDDLVIFLCRYQKDRWIAESINQIELTENSNELQISYYINFFSGCKDIDEDDIDYIVVEYKVNLENEEIEIIGEAVPEERSTLDEF